MTIKLPDGLTYRAKHQRRYGKSIVDPLPNGGKTVVEVGKPRHDVDGSFLSFDVVAVGVATCNNKDRYNKKIGREIALGRALKELDAVVVTDNPT